MRVLFLATYFPRPGNPVMGVWALAQAKAFQRAGLDVLVVSPTLWLPRFVGHLGFKPTFSLCPAVLNFGGVEVRYPRWLFYMWGHFDPRRHAIAHRLGWFSLRRRLRQIVREWKPDVVYCHHGLPNGEVARRLQDEFGLPFVCTEHSFGDIDQAKADPVWRRLAARVAHAAHTTIAVCGPMLEGMKIAYAGANLRLVHNGAEPVPESVKRSARPRELEGKTVVLCAAWWYQRKGIPNLIRAFTAVAQRHPDAVLRLVGDGADRPAIEAAVRESGLGPDRIQLVGLQPHEHTLREIAWCDVFALLSWEEPFATVLIEAASAGKAMIWCNTGGICDVLVDSVHGFAVPPRDVPAAARALDELLGNKDERARMGAAAAALASERLTWDANALAMREIFTQAADSARRVSRARSASEGH